MDPFISSKKDKETLAWQDGFHLPNILFSWKIPFFKKMLQEKWQNKAHIYIRQYVHIDFFENIDMKQVFIQK